MDDPRPAEAATPTLSIGDVVSDRYRIEAVLGEGGMGVVYRAEHLHLHKPFALKVLLPEWSCTPEVVARFEREAIAAGNIQSPHVAAATDFGRLQDGSFFLVMEYVSGRTLRSALQAGAFELPRALHVLEGIAEGLGAAHALGFVHRDLKPENVMLVERDGDPDFVKILDFGIAKVDPAAASGVAASQRVLTRVGAIIGTPDYMSPEQALGQPVDARSDLYSAGVILFEMLAGQCPFAGGAVTVLRQHVMGETPELPPDVRARVDARVASLLRLLLAKAPDNRPASATEMLAAIHECAPAPSPPRVVVVARSAPRWTMADPGAILGRLRERRTMVVVAIAIGVAILVGIVARPEARENAPAAPAPTLPATAAAASTALSPVSAPSESEAPVTVLPPPPAPSASSSSSAKHAAGRHTGPGGIYIPPPSQWFR